MALWFVSFAHDSCVAALSIIFITTALLSALATNNAAAVLMFPVALSVAEKLDVSFLPFAITLMVAASASFATPIGYQTNLMVFGAGGYHFKDYLVFGLPLTLFVGVLTVALVPLVWRFS
jgi:di/tricarboxylate transporter